MKRLLTPALAVLLMLTVGPWGASAQDGDTLGIRSSTGDSLAQVTFELEPGDADELAVQVPAGNLVVRIAGVTSPPNGGLAVQDAETDLDEPATWLALNGGELSVRVPNDARPGQYLAAVVVESTATEAPAGELPQRERAITWVTITVVGTMMPGFAVGEPSVVTTGLARLVFPLRNTGTVPVAPTGNLTLESDNDTVVIPLALGVVVPGASTSIDLVLPDDLAAGNYEVSLTLTDEGSGAQASLKPVSVRLPERTEGAVTHTDTASPVSILNPDVVMTGSPLQSATISADIANSGPPVVGATVVLEVRRDGQLVEAVSIVEFARITDGTVTFSTVYVPEGTFGSGLWTFRLRLEAPGPDGEPEILAQTGTVAKIDVP